MAVKIRRGDTVLIIAGKNRGAQGKVIRVNRVKNRVLVEGANIVTKHIRESKNGSESSSIEMMEAPLHLSNVMLIDPASKQPTRVGWREVNLENGKPFRVRVAKLTGEDIKENE